MMDILMLVLLFALSVVVGLYLFTRAQVRHAEFCLVVDMDGMMDHLKDMELLFEDSDRLLTDVQTLIAGAIAADTRNAPRD